MSHYNNASVCIYDKQTNIQTKTKYKFHLIVRMIPVVIMCPLSLALTYRLHADIDFDTLDMCSLSRLPILTHGSLLFP